MRTSLAKRIASSLDVLTHRLGEPARLTTQILVALLAACLAVRAVHSSATLPSGDDVPLTGYALSVAADSQGARS